MGGFILEILCRLLFERNQFMKKENEIISYSENEIFEVMKEIEIMLQSFHKAISHYSIAEIEDVKNFKQYDFESEITNIVCEWDVPKRLAKVRQILSQRIDLTLGEDNMDDLERELEGVGHWNKPGDKP
jgi:hypothetical protein